MRFGLNREGRLAVLVSLIDADCSLSKYTRFITRIIGPKFNSFLPAFQYFRLPSHQFFFCGFSIAIGLYAGELQNRI